MVSVYLQCPWRFVQVKHSSLISERLARKWVILVFGLDKRSGRPEQ